ncbi:MAG: PEP-CTERM sorting domain-containing protein [Phycisphaeraceae bacterium]
MSHTFHLPQDQFITTASRKRFAAFGRVTLAVAFAVATSAATAHASAIFGTLSNFDIYFTSPDPVGIPGCEGAEIELEGIHSSDIGGDFPAHYTNRTIAEYNDASDVFAGTRITYTGYNFGGALTPGTLPHNPSPASTNGHQLTATAGGEHFGFWLSGAQPTATRFFWLDDVGGSYVRIGTTPVAIPGPTWTYVPPAQVGDPPVVQVVVKVPEPVEPPEIPEQRPDSIWMKLYKVKLATAPQDPVEMQNLLMQLISDANPNNDQPDDPLNDVPDGGDPAEVEMEWELLEGGRAPKERMNDDPIEEGSDKMIIRRYEFYEYTGVYDEEHEPVTLFTEMELLEPPDGELGNFISANMVAAVLNPIPEPSAIAILGLGTGLLALRRRRA